MASEPRISNAEEEALAISEAAREELKMRIAASKFKPQMTALFKFQDKTKTVPILGERDLEKLQLNILGLEDAMGLCDIEESFRDLMSCATLGRDLMKLDRVAAALVRDSGVAGDLSSMRKMGQAQSFKRAVEKLEDALVEEVMAMTKTCLCDRPRAAAAERGPEG